MKLFNKLQFLVFFCQDITETVAVGIFKLNFTLLKNKAMPVITRFKKSLLNIKS